MWWPCPGPEACIAFAGVKSLFWKLNSVTFCHTYMHYKNMRSVSHIFSYLSWFTFDYCIVLLRQGLRTEKIQIKNSCFLLNYPLFPFNIMKCGNKNFPKGCLPGIEQSAREGVSHPRGKNSKAFLPVHCKAGIDVQGPDMVSE